MGFADDMRRIAETTGRTYRTPLRVIVQQPDHPYTNMKYIGKNALENAGKLVDSFAENVNWKAFEGDGHGGIIPIADRDWLAERNAADAREAQLR
ncbi:hypothetical protein [Agromyces humi]|uniref:hypothetical protein n=1 Tax=Agromyces humi TaxID=1766800 RepID=UPI00135C40FB|nr:hypothetical protein [Agromyces humi]